MSASAPIQPGSTVVTQFGPLKVVTVEFNRLVGMWRVSGFTANGWNAAYVPR